MWREALGTAIGAITSLWFGYLMLYHSFIILHLYLMFYVHPAVILILPSVLTIYLVFLDGRRRTNELKALLSTDRKFLSPEEYAEYLQEVKKKKRIYRF